MKRTFLTLAILAAILAVPAILLAHEYRPGKMYDCCRAHASRNIGRVCVKITEANDEFWFGELIIIDRNGKITHRGKPSSEASLENRSEFDALYGTPYGLAWAEAACDLDGDGSDEILISEPKSDVSPQEYRVLRWKDGELSLVRRGYLTVEGSHARWTDKSLDERPWLTGIKERKDGSVEGTVIQLTNNGGGVAHYKVLLRHEKGGFSLIKIR